MILVRLEYDGWKERNEWENVPSRFEFVETIKVFSDREEKGFIYRDIETGNTYLYFENGDRKIAPVFTLLDGTYK